MNGFAPGVIPRVNRSKLAFKQMENLSHYLKACEKVGLKQTALFQTIDLFEGKDMGVVITALNQLRQHATKHNNDLSSFVQKVSSAAPKGPSAARYAEWRGNERRVREMRLERGKRRSSIGE